MTKNSIPSFLSDPPKRGRPSHALAAPVPPIHIIASAGDPGTVSGWPAQPVANFCDASSHGTSALHVRPLPVSVTLADDNRMFREALQTRVRQVLGSVEIREVRDAQELFATCAMRPGFRDLFLIDMSLSNLRGSAGLREMRRLRPDAMMVAINCPADPNEARIALEVGASAYVLRSACPETFAAVLALVLNGERFFPAALLLEALHSATQRSICRSPDEGTGSAYGGSGLTPRQLSVMRHIAVGRTNKEIARVLNIQEITVKVHLQAIFARINVTNRTQAAMHAERSGWFLGEPVPVEMTAESKPETTH